MSRGICVRKPWVIVIFCVTCVVTALVIALSLACNVKTVNVNVMTGGYRDLAEQSVVRVTDAYRGRSIFFVDEQEIASAIEADFAKTQQSTDTVVGLEVIGVERKFPSTLTVHVVTKYAHAYLAAPHGYVIVDNDLRALKVVDTVPQGLTEIVSRPLTTVTEATVGEVVRTSEAAVVRIADATYYGLARLGYGAFDAVGLIERMIIDTVTDTVTLVTTAPDGNGSEIVIDGTAELNAKIRLGVSVYVADDAYKTGHRITVTTSKGKLVALKKELE